MGYLNTMENKTRGQELELRIKQREDFIEGLLFEINIKDSESISKEITNDKWWIEWTSELKGIIETEKRIFEIIETQMNEFNVWENMDNKKMQLGKIQALKELKDKLNGGKFFSSQP